MLLPAGRVCTRSGIDANRLVLLGHSVGAGATLLHAAHHDDVCAVISLSAFANPSEMMRRFLAGKRVPYPVIGWYVMRHVQRVLGATFDQIAPMATLPRVRCPVLLVHGRTDTTVPVDGARYLIGLSPQPTRARAPAQLALLVAQVRSSGLERDA